MTDHADLIKRYQALISQSADIITLIDEEAVIEYQSPAVERVLGYEQDELVGRPVLEFVHPADREAVTAAIAEAMAEPEAGVHRAEYRFRHQDGSWVTLESVAARRTDGEAGFVVNSRDVTEERRRDEALSKQRSLYESVVEQVNDGILITRDRTIVFANARAHELLGYADGHLVGQSVDSIVDTEDRDRVQENYEQRMDPDAPPAPTRYEVRFLTQSGDRLVGEVNVKSIEYEGDPAVLVALRDVTARKRYESELESLSEELEALNRVVRHDIRNDMAVVLGWTELLEDYVDTEGRQYLEKIQASGQHIVELTEIARDYIEALTSEEPAPLRPMPLRSLVETEVALRRDYYPAASIRIEDEIPDVTVQANETLASVLSNLLNNAVQHNPSPEPTVVVSASIEDGSATIRVADDGPGIPDDRKEAIFGKRETGIDSPGSGIGLYLVRTLVEGFGGSVHVVDNEPEGAVFVVDLPLAE